MDRSIPKQPWQAPELNEIDLLADTGLGFSEPDPPSRREGGDEGEQDREAYDWL